MSFFLLEAIYNKRFLTFLLIILSTLKIKAEVGCSDGTYIYTQPSGTFIIENSNSHVPRYQSSSRIYIKNWSGDNCGIPREKVNAYPTATSAKNPEGKCALGNQYASRQLHYNPADNDCVPLPIDDHFGLIVIASGVVGVYFISKKYILA